MDLHNAVTQLKVQGQALTHLGSGLSEKQARWKPSPESWSLLEVLNHLVNFESLQKEHGQPIPKADRARFIFPYENAERLADLRKSSRPQSA